RTTRRPARAISGIISSTISAARSAPASRPFIAMRPKPVLSPTRERCGFIDVTIDQIAAKVGAGERIGADEALELYRLAPTALLGRLADCVRARKHPTGLVTYIIDRNVNYTNVCVAKCN